MANTLAQKLRIKEQFALRTLNAPKKISKQLGPVPAKVTISATTKKYDQVHWFVLNRAQMEKEMSKVMKMLKPEVIV